MDENMRRARELVNALVQTNNERFITYGFLSPQWWLLLAFMIVPWLIWAKVVDRKRKLEIVLVGVLVGIVTKCLDTIGYHLNFWDYPIEMVPTIPEALAFDLSMIPVAYMLLYQYFKTGKSYFFGLLYMSVVYAFIGEPFCNWIMVVTYIKWTYIYSFVYYIVIGIIVKAIVENLKGACSINGDR